MFQLRYKVVNPDLKIIISNKSLFSLKLFDLNNKNDIEIIVISFALLGFFFNFEKVVQPLVSIKMSVFERIKILKFKKVLKKN